MRITAAIMVAMLVGGLTVVTQAQTSPATYSDSINGVVVTPHPNGNISLKEQATGGVAGTIDMSIQYDPVKNVILGGTWTLTAFQQNSSGKLSYRGTLNGTVSSGTVTVDQTGVLTSAGPVQLTINGGAGAFSQTKTGTGTLSGTLTSPPTPTFSGNLVLSF
jgi:hypothetical protein